MSQDSTLSPTEAMILGLLAESARGAYGSELVHRSKGQLKRGTVYSLLGRLVDKGYVVVMEEEPTFELALPRGRYRIAAAGVTARANFADFVRLQTPHLALGVL